ncbi:peptidoglycan-binding protein [Streptomyces sp. MBT27]|uniref:peptidoglycan-binding protein n=1 Tax=Streptomyces sp. MBT27 TaxID=1488356 RepID=UPI0014233162|nr:peptidoglycan-binding protein [Streptomyces sp. MBT27]
MAESPTPESGIPSVLEPEREVRSADGAAQRPSGDGIPPAASALIRRQRILLIVAAGAVLLSVGGLVASVFVRSPAQDAAGRRAPDPTVLTAPVQQRVLTKSVVLRGTVTAGGSVGFTPVAGQSAGSAAGALLLTGIRKKAGSAIAPGDVLVEVSGRPVLALPGGVPAYRDLKPGDTGKDVGELQDALRRLGYADRDPSGTFGPRTKAAIAALYADRGYDPPDTGGPHGASDRQALTAGRQAVTAAERALAAARATRDAAKDAAAASAAGTQLAYATQDLTTARQSLDELVAHTGVMLPLAEFTFVPSFPARLSAVNGTVGTPVAAPLLVIDSGRPVVTTVLTQDQKSALREGMKVRLSAEVLGQDAEGAVTALGAYTNGVTNSGRTGGSSAGQNGSTGGGQGGQGNDVPQARAGYPLTVTPDTDLPAPWLGLDVRVTVTAAASPGPVLVVPATAVSAGADGRTSVLVRARSGTQDRVPVTAGMDADGYVAVTAAPGHRLVAGDDVVVGR